MVSGQDTSNAAIWRQCCCTVLRHSWTCSSVAMVVGVPECLSSPAVGLLQPLAHHRESGLARELDPLQSLTPFRQQLQRLGNRFRRNAVVAAIRDGFARFYEDRRVCPVVGRFELRQSLENDVLISRATEMVGRGPEARVLGVKNLATNCRPNHPQQRPAPLHRFAHLVHCDGAVPRRGQLVLSALELFEHEPAKPGIERFDELKTKSHDASFLVRGLLALAKPRRQPFGEP